MTPADKGRRDERPAQNEGTEEEKRFSRILSSAISETLRHTAHRRMRGTSYPALRNTNLQKRQNNTPLRPRRGDYRSPAVARKVASPHQEPKNWHLAYNTIYVAALCPTGSCSQDI